MSVRPGAWALLDGRRRRRATSAVRQFGAVGWWRAGVGLVDTAGLVDSWTDPVTGLVLSSTGADRPARSTVDTFDSPEFSAASYAAAGKHLSKTDLAFGTNPTFTMFFVGRAKVATAYYTYARIGANLYLLHDRTVGTNNMWEQRNGVNTYEVAAAIETLDVRRVWAFVSTPSKVTMWRTDDAGAFSKVKDVTRAGTVGSMTGLRVGEIGGSYGFRGPMHSVALFDGDLEATGGMLPVAAELKALYGV